MTRPIIVIGHLPGGGLKALYIGGDGAEAEAAFEAAGSPDFERVEEVRFPPISRRRDFEVPILGTEESVASEVEKPAEVEEPKVEQTPKSPTKAEIKKAEKAAKDAAKAAAAQKSTEEAEF